MLTLFVKTLNSKECFKNVLIFGIFFKTISYSSLNKSNLVILSKYHFNK